MPLPSWIPVDEAVWSFIQTWILTPLWNKFKDRKKKIEEAVEGARNFVFKVVNDGKHDNLRTALGWTHVGEFDQETVEEVIACAIEDAKNVTPHENKSLIDALEALAKAADKQVAVVEKARALAEKLAKGTRGADRQKAYQKALEVALKEAEAMNAAFEAHAAVIDAAHNHDEHPGEESARQILDILEVMAKADIEYTEEKLVGRRKKQVPVDRTCEKSVALKNAIDLLDKETFVIKVWRYIKNIDSAKALEVAIKAWKTINKSAGKAAKRLETKQKALWGWSIFGGSRGK